MKRFFCFLLIVVNVFAFSSREFVAFAEPNNITTTITAVKLTKTGMKVSWTKKKVNGYQIEYSKAKSFKNKKIITINNGKTKSKSIYNLGVCAKYFVRIRTFVKAKKVKVFSKWSKIKTININHNYSLATCYKAKTCNRCGDVVGVPLTHIYTDATCLSAKKCTLCRKLEGSALGHTYAEPTCTTPSTCERCGTIVKSALGHSYQWNSNTCERCGNVDESIQLYTASLGQTLPLTFTDFYEYGGGVSSRMQIQACEYEFVQTGSSATLKLTITASPTYDDFFSSDNCMFYCNVTGPNGCEREELVITSTVRIGKTVKTGVNIKYLVPGDYTIRFYSY